MKIGIILFIVASVILLILTKKEFNKTIIKNIFIFISIILFLYSLILIVQPDEKTYFDYTTTTISK